MLNERYFETPAMPVVPRRTAADLADRALTLFAALLRDDSEDPCVFSGVPGHLYTSMIGCDCFGTAPWYDGRQLLKESALRLPLPKRLGTFVEGNTGPCALMVALDGEARLAPLLDAACKANADASLPDELWYGRAGILHSLFVARTPGHVGVRDATHTIMIELFDEIVSRGSLNGRGTEDHHHHASTQLIRGGNNPLKIVDGLLSSGTPPMILLVLIE